MMGSFGPVVALSSLSNNLNQTLASGERVLSLLEETPLVEEIPGDVETPGTESVEHEFTGAEAENVTFAYDNEVILDNYSLKMQTREDHRYSWCERFWKIYAFKTADAVLGCAGWKRIGRRYRCPKDLSGI